MKSGSPAGEVEVAEEEADGEGKELLEANGPSALHWVTEQPSSGSTYTITSSNPCSLGRVIDELDDVVVVSDGSAATLRAPKRRDNRGLTIIIECFNERNVAKAANQYKRVTEEQKSDWLVLKSKKLCDGGNRGKCEATSYIKIIT